MNTTQIKHGYNMNTTKIKHGYIMDTTQIKHGYNMNEKKIKHGYNLDTTLKKTLIQYMMITYCKFIVTKRIIIMEVSLSRLDPGIFHENKIFYETSSYRIRKN